MEDRLKVVKLPSGREAKVVRWFTRGEAKQIEKARWEGAQVEQEPDGTVIMKGIPVLQTVLEQDALVLQGTKAVDGAEFNQEALDSLDEKDFKFLHLVLTKVRSEETKKEKSAKS